MRSLAFILTEICLHGASMALRFYAWAFKKQNWLVSLAMRWAYENPRAGGYKIASILQPWVSRVTGLQVCKHCRWVVIMGDTHGYCEMKIKVGSLGDEDLLRAFVALLADLFPADILGPSNGATEDEWFQEVEHQIGLRGLSPGPWFQEQVLFD